VTRWFRAPELMLSPDGLYSSAVDVWAAGCVLAELLGRRSLFPGRTYQDVVRLQIEVLGSRPPAELEYIRSTEAVAYLRALPLSSRKPWRELFPSCSHRCAAVLDALLAWHPASRATAASAMQLAYFDSVRSSYAEEEPPPAALDLHSFEVAAPPLTASDLRALVVAEAALLRAEQAAAAAAAAAEPTTTALPAPAPAVLTAAERRG
jgi:serine/threonine protein kinase